ncbi:MAG: hypothetical protein HKN78_00430 [Sphingomonadaceae bacterium]|nr:hypothetical protein [Sphingomonadaceae bacterium]
MQKLRTPLAVAPFAALLFTAACGQSEPDVVGEMSDPNADEIEELDPSEMPAMVRGSQSYRCGDGSVVYVTYYTNDTQAGVSATQDGVPTILTNDALAAPAEAEEGEEVEGEETDSEEAAPEDTNGPIRFSGEGQTLVGTGSTVTYNGQTCNS